MPIEAAYLSASKVSLLKDAAAGDLVSVLPLTASGLLGAELVSLSIVPETPEEPSNKAQGKLLSAFIKQTLCRLSCS
jgi:hypothetical protein